MPNVSFSLYGSKTNKKGLSPVYVSIPLNTNPRFSETEIDRKAGYVNCKKATGIWIKPAHWNPEPREKDGIPQFVRQPRPDQPENNHKEINGKLKAIRDDAKQYFEYCQANNIAITPQLVKDFLNGKKKQKSKPRKKSFWDAANDYLEQVELTMESSTSRAKKSFFKSLRTFESETKQGLTFENMSVPLFDKYKQWLLENRGLSSNYLSVHTRWLKAFLRWSTDRNYYTGLEHRKFKAPEKAKTIVSLSYSELLRLASYPFKQPGHQKARDIFVFGSFTGLRISDSKKLDRGHLQDGCIRLIVQKTKQELFIPLAQEALKIIEKQPHTHFLLPRLCEQRVNKFIKECCQIAGIDSPVKIKTHRAGVMKEETYPKYELISTHTARKNFITLTYARGLDTQMIKAITGIRADTTLRKYLAIDERTKREKIQQVWDDGNTSNP